MDDASRCWNCQTRPAEPYAAHRVKLKRTVETSFFMVGYQERWEERTVEVPRCSRCRRQNRVHDGLGKLVATVVTVAAVLVVIGVIGELAGDDHIFFQLAGAVVAAGVVLSIPFRFYIRRHPRQEPERYPAVAELIEQGWSRG